MANTPNWQHHSRKTLKGRGRCKGAMRARRQSLKALLRKLKAKASHGE